MTTVILTGIRRLLPGEQTHDERMRGMRNAAHGYAMGLDKDYPELKYIADFLLQVADDYSARIEKREPQDDIPLVNPWRPVQ